MATNTNQPRTITPTVNAGSKITESLLQAIADAINGRRGASNPSTQRTR